MSQRGQRVQTQGVEGVGCRCHGRGRGQGRLQMSPSPSFEVTLGDPGPPSPALPLTVGGVRPEGDLDFELPVGVLDGGQRQEGAGALREVGYHPLCRQRGQ